MVENNTQQVRTNPAASLNHYGLGSAPTWPADEHRLPGSTVGLRLLTCLLGQSLLVLLTDMCLSFLTHVTF